MNVHVREIGAERAQTRAAKLGIAAASGAVLPFAFAPFGVFPLAPLSYALLFALWRGERPSRAFRLGLVYGLASFLGGVHWVYVSLNTYGLLHPLIAGSMTLLFVTVLALFPAVTGALAARLQITSGAVSWLVALPALWVLIEWLRGWIFTGFGWLSAGYSQTDSWLMALAPVGGLHAMSWAVVVTAGALVTLALGDRRARVIAGAVAALVWLGAFAIRGVDFTQPKDEPVSVALVQGAIPQDLKWQPSQLAPTLNLYRSLTRQAAGSRLIVWPEAAMPVLYDDISGWLGDVAEETAARGSTLVLGILVGTPEDFGNSVVAMTDTPQFYTKRHLVPFGEYFPVPGFVREHLRLMNLPHIDAEPGPSNQPPLDVAGERLAVTICYEALFGAEQLHYLPEATLLVNVSNDAWFGDSIMPHQHLQIARLRAAEAGRYLLRSTNTGITAVIDPRGRVASTIPQFEPGVLKAVVQGFTGATPYAVVGNWPVITGALLAVGIVVLRRRRGPSAETPPPAASRASPRRRS
ncbi:MAG: apolipoprotein N-acyltransferase [Gammaproteobacteria bacterium]